MINVTKGSLVCLGVGITLGSHISILAKNYIEQADVVFSLVSDGVVEQWVESMNENTRSLQSFYQEGVSRNITYQNMVMCILAEVKKGKHVVAAFYGHPGVFACVPHQAILEAKALGYSTIMEPGISSEDCLFADLAIDPGEYGCAQFEASQFMFFQRKIDPSAYLILWQVCIAGDISLTKFTKEKDYIKVLVEVLTENYPAEHNVILYEAPTLPIHSPRKEYLPLSQLVTAQLNQQTTLIIPPSKEMSRNDSVLTRLSSIKKKSPLTCVT